ncbi:hypothetical protein NSQ77_10790 [Oceanobacillus sp. FSL K6-2867]
MDFKMADNKGENTLMLKAEIKAGTKIAIASAYFSLFAYMYFSLDVFLKD